MSKYAFPRALPPNLGGGNHCTWRKHALRANFARMKHRTRYGSISQRLFVENRARLRALLLPNSLAAVNANDVLPTNADGSLRLVTNTDLFYLTGIEQEQSILVLYPDAHDEKHRELLFIRDVEPDLEIWEGHKLTKEETRALSQRVSATVSPADVRMRARLLEQQ